MTAPVDGTTVTVRAATAEDVPWLASCALQLAWETEQRRLDHATVVEGVAAGIADPRRARYAVARSADGTPVGSLMLTTEWSDWRNGDWWWIQSVYVVPGHRRAGVYTALHRHVERAARTTPGVLGLRLYAERDNHAALATYARMGMGDGGYVFRERAF